MLVDGRYVGMVGRDGDLRLQAPPGSYMLKVQFGGPVPIGRKGRSIDLSLSASKLVEVPPAGDVTYEFSDREWLWNILFDADLVAWVVSWFVQMPPVYKIVSNAFFAVWLVRLVLIRKKYYRIVKV